METPYHKRMELVRRSMAEAKADALLLAHPPNLFYLCGFSGSSSVLLIEQSVATLFTDGRYAIQARQEVKAAHVEITRSGLLAAVGKRLRKLRGVWVALESAHMTIAQQAELQRASGARIRWIELENCVEALRSVKEPAEIARIRDAAQIGSEVFHEILPLVKPGVREIELAAEIEYRLRRKGASGAAFETIVASGERSALPHARATAKPLRKNELVVFDLGAILHHYCCDLTRTVFLGRAPSRVGRWYRAVLEAQAAAQEALRPGATGAQVDHAARRVLRQHGLSRYFVHSTGHGVGLEVHEEPRLARGQNNRMQAGNVVTLEPGVYIEGSGGIRIEDDVVVLPRGTELLTSASREFLQL